jgi:hypothetical protein
MAIEYWIQLENRPWDLSPHNVDRMTSQNMQAVTGQPPAMVTLTSVVPGTPPRMVTMFNPLRDGANVIDALILRRYRPPTQPDGSDAWTVPGGVGRRGRSWPVQAGRPRPSRGDIHLHLGDLRVALHRRGMAVPRSLDLRYGQR